MFNEIHSTEQTSSENSRSITTDIQQDGYNKTNVHEQHGVLQLDESQDCDSETKIYQKSDSGLWLPTKINQNLVDETNKQRDIDSTNSNFSKHCCNVSFNTAQKVHYYEAERTNKKSKAGLWLQL